MTRPVDWESVFGFGDPTPGDPPQIRSLARRFADVSDDAADAEARVRGVLSDGELSAWIGEGGDAFRAKTADLPDQLRKAKESYRLASDALTTWAHRLEIHQGSADRALNAGRAAQADLEQALSAVALAGGSSVLADARRYADQPDLAPSADQVSAAQARLRHAQSSQATAQSQLDLARQMALDAAALRDEDAATAASSIREAAEAGIPERSRWDKFKDWAADAWHVVVEIAKIVVLVLGIVALIIGGPLAWVVVAAALLVLADTIARYLRGEASGWDVMWAALDCIPATKGITSAARLKTMLREGVSMSRLGRGGLRYAGLLLREPGLALRQFASNPIVRLERMALQVRHMSPAAALREGAAAFASARADGRGVWGALNAAESARYTHFRDGFDAYVHTAAAADPARAAQLWQGGGGYFGVDDLSNVTVHPGDRFVTTGPGISGWAASPASADLATTGGAYQAAAYNEGVQVGADVRFSPPYRPDGYVIEVTQTHQVAAGTASANTQFGPGGFEQISSPHLDWRVGSDGANDYFTVIDRFHFDPSDAITDTVRTQAESQGLREALRAPVRGYGYLQPSLQGSEP